MNLDELRHLIVSGFHARPALIYAACAEHIALASHMGDEQRPDHFARCAAAFGMSEPKRDKPYLFADGMAVIPIHGTLVNRFSGSWGSYTGYQFIRNQFDAAMADPEVKGVVFDVNSPGGQVYGNFELADHIREGRAAKPSIAIVDSMAASGGYSLASAAGKVIVAPSGDVGSIGVVMMHVDQSKMLKDIGIKVSMIYAGKHKVDGNPFEALSEDVRADIQNRIDSDYGDFVSLVSKNRGMRDQAVRDTEARVYGATEAKKVGLVDAIMTPAEALAAFRSELSGSITQRSRSMSTNTEAGIDKPADVVTPAAAAAVVAAPAPSAAEAVKAERERSAGILNCEEAKGRDALAKHFATKTSMSVEDAQAALAVAPKEAAASPAFSKAMDASDNPNISAGKGAPSETPDSKPDVAARIAAAFQLAQGIKAH